MPGHFYDQFQIGQTFKHAIRRTVTEADNVFFSALTHNPAALHLDEEYCREHTEFGQRIVNSAFTLGLMVGITVGDTVRVETEVLQMRESKSRPGQGIVVFLHRAFNQKQELVAHCKRSALMLKATA